jgi:hypothetical protein
MYQLKPNFPDFTVVDGPFAGRSYQLGKTYQDIPPQEAHKFDEVAEAAPQISPKNKKNVVSGDPENQQKED